MHFSLVDSVIEQTDERIVTVKNVTSAEEYLGDHFPSFPILPGVMMLECMVQAARELVGDEGGPHVLGQVRNVKYGNMVCPGQQLRVEVDVKKRDDDSGGVSFQGKGTVDDDTAVSGRFTLRPVRSQ